MRKLALPPEQLILLEGNGLKLPGQLLQVEFIGLLEEGAGQEHLVHCFGLILRAMVLENRLVGVFVKIADRAGADG